MNEIETRRLTILYGSVTGNSQDLAERVWRESKRFYFTGSVKAMDDYSIKNLVNEECVIFVCSTTGQGKEPDNMKNSWKFLLRKDLPLNCLSNLKFSVLGLGDSSYVKYNVIAKCLHNRLLQLGGNAILPLALGDDQHDLGYDAVADVWIEDLWAKLLEIYPLPDKLQPKSSDIKVEPRFNVEVVDNPEITAEANLNVMYHNIKSIYLNESVKDPEDIFSIKVVRNKLTTSTSNTKAVHLLTLRNSGRYYYSPGDVLHVRPRNSADHIKEFYDVLKLNGVNIPPETVFKISETNSEIVVPRCLRKEITFQALCEEYFDLSAIPRRSVFKIFAQLTSSELEKEKCIEFTTAEGQNELYNYINRPKRNIVEVLADFPHVVENITIEMLFEILTPIKSRAFSIASNFNFHVNQIQILVAVVKYKTRLVKERLGLCSNWLAKLKVGDVFPVWMRNSTLKFPKTENPVIMVGPGTGVAPFRSFLYELSQQSILPMNNVMLFFGCRHKEHDFHCREDFEKLQKERQLCLICAFSRDQEHKIYVQHKIEENAEKVWQLLSTNNAYIFVAGSSKNMPQAVREAFVNVVKLGKNVTQQEAENFIKQMEKNRHYQTETWS